MPWLLNAVYLLLLLALSPVLAYRFLLKGKYRAGWRQKFLGELPAREPGRPRVWFHAVSVGEVLLLRPVLKRFTELRPDCDVVLSTTTSTGYDVARAQFPEHTVCYFPLDFSWAVRRAIRRVCPSVVALVELELWPNFLLAAQRLGVPVVLINGRLSEHSYRGYRKIRPLLARLLKGLAEAGVQSPTYAERLVDLGAPRQRVLVTGSVKFDGVETDRNNERTQELRRSFGLKPDEVVWVVGSTHAPEEELALQSWLELKDRFPNLRLVLVPRHKERFEEVAELVRKAGLPLVRRSRVLAGGQRESDSSARTAACPSSSTQTSLAQQPPKEVHNQADRPVLLLDTLGELSACWGLADIAFVGGSLTSRGGQNMIEPSAYGAAVLFGPNTHNFRDVVELLLAHDAARVVRSGDELTQAVAELLENPERARAMGQRARQTVLSQQGATEKTVELLCRHLPPVQQTAERPAAEAA